MTYNLSPSDCYLKSYIGHLNNDNDPRNEKSISLIHKALSSHYTSVNVKGEGLLELVDAFLSKGGNPNLTFKEISVGDNYFRNTTFFHVVYIYWKDPSMQYSPKTNRRYEKIIDQMMNDPRLDLSAIFTESRLCDSSHFVHDGRNEEDGYLLEKMNIAHYAMTLGDFTTVTKVLERAPDLLHSSCCLTKGKNLLSRDLVFSKLESDVEKADSREALEKLEDLDHTVSGIIATSLIIDCFFPIERSTKVTLLHLAARMGDIWACSYFYGKGSNFNQDSEKRFPVDYLKLSLEEGLVDKSIGVLLIDKLKPIVKLNKQIIPKTNIILKRDGFIIDYNTKNKTANFVYERLTKNSLEKNTDRSNISFKVDWEIPKLNRAGSSEYANSGFERGHLVPAGNCISSEQAMKDTFLFSNICPQNPTLNKGYWKKLEKKVLQKIEKYDLIEVFTGPLFIPEIDNDKKFKISYETIGKGQIAVPTHFFKVLYLHNKSTKCVAYILPNEKIGSLKELRDFKNPVDKVQSLSGIIFNEWRKPL